ncbi:MAG: hypothetical protein IPJ69_14950 [Deltaproteobacteria bacterium]|nr:MAG: hypothetical protein IPJ69_14950 [Deltaproteobacteria bacterium]
MSKTPSNNPMKFIWDHQAQAGPDGKKYIRYSHNGEIAYLYRTGFVDTDKFTQEEWLASFNSSKRSDGSYWLTEEQWMAKQKFVYLGPVGTPLEPPTLQEGLWPVKDFEILLKTQILPAVDIDEKSLRALLPNKGIQLDKSGKILLTKDFKAFLQNLILDRPSPTQARAASLKEAQKNIKNPAVSPKSPTVSQKSAFSMGPSKAQQSQNQFSQLLSKK